MQNLLQDYALLLAFRSPILLQYETSTIILTVKATASHQEAMASGGLITDDDVAKHFFKVLLYYLKVETLPF